VRPIAHPRASNPPVRWPNCAAAEPAITRTGPGAQSDQWERKAAPFLLRRISVSRAKRSRPMRRRERMAEREGRRRADVLPDLPRGKVACRRAVRWAQTMGGLCRSKLEELLVAIFVGLDVHSAQIPYDALDTNTGEVRTGRIRPANPRNGAGVSDAPGGQGDGCRGGGVTGGGSLPRNVSVRYRGAFR
jgi:hypothetical protein